MSHFLEEINPLIGAFEPITLAQMDAVKLMNRTDRKFVFHQNQLPTVLRAMQAHYRLLTVGHTNFCRYQTLYYDTPDHQLYSAHQAGHLNRYKIRHRSYLDTDAAFFEIKLKSNKGRTIKTRIPQTGQAGPLILGDNHQFVASTTPLDPDALQGVLWVDYQRLTFVHRHQPERLTIDLDLRFRYGQCQHEYPRLVIAEVKQEQRQQPSPFIDTMRALRLPPGGLSKFCLGMMSVFPDLKSNRFKTKRLRIHKLLGQA
ncbi:MAG: polyphosphate polymerase domain-containing protein [Bernardetiaceae bacterium]|nr:polyphosphate polymerase domain-containing protein [Bernardetiaceae bacterium]